MRCAFLLLALALAGSPAAAQPADAVGDVRAAYQRLDYDEAARQALAAIEAGGLHRDQLVELHTILALVAYSRDDLDEARRQFGLALDLDPGLVLDPLLVSPKIVAFFDEVRQTRRTAAPAEGTVPDVRYVVLRDGRPDAALRSMLVPGWGQLYKGERTKGWVLAGLWGLTATGSLYAHVRWQDARDAYRAERDPGRVDDRYARADAWYKARNNLVLGAAGVWLVSYVDALLRHHERPVATGRSARLQLAPSASPGQARLSLRVQF